MPSSHPPVTLATTEQHTLLSSDGDREYRIFVALPQSYDVGERTYPVIYLLDGNSLFPIMAETARLLRFYGEIRELIVVGVGYAEADTFLATMAARTRDLTPSAPGWYETGCRASMPDAPESLGEGGAAAFLGFLREELAPFIATHYRIDPEDSSLLGFSFGGLFALYSLFEQPQAFRQYFICSPSVWWDNELILEREAAYAAEHTDLPARVFMGVGGAEPAVMVADMYRVARALGDREYRSLELTSHFFEDESHMSVITAFISRSLRKAFSSD
jgi:predicted alpha/beta superfamily hydrolase